MIERIIIEDVATFKKQVQVDPQKVNYIYGSNGSGKTTISRVLSNPSLYPKCIVISKSTSEETCVYNREYVDENFRQDKLKGIFTLGNEVPEVKMEIEERRKEVERQNLMISGFKSSLETVVAKGQVMENEYQNKFWETKTKYYDHFKEALTGSIGSKILFKDKCIQEQDNEESLESFEYLAERYNALYNTDPKPIDEVSKISLVELTAVESAPIFTQPIIGKTETQIGRLIEFLGNSDWVNKGLEYLEKSEKNECPFCQKPLEDSLRDEIVSFFDKSYIEDSTRLEQAIREYTEYVESGITQVKELLEKDIPVFQFQRLPDLLKAIEAEFQSNKAKLKYKLEFKSQMAVIVSLKPLFDEAMIEVDTCIQKIQEYNNVINNIKAEKGILNRKVWRLLAEETKPVNDGYQKDKRGIESGIANLRQKISESEKIVVSCNQRIRELEASITSVSFTVTEINRILAGFNFQGFRLAEAQERGYYHIVRDDGSIVKDTLSEGEFTFISFLYFYHFLKGSTKRDGVTKNRIVVIDDPISSLDSNVLFIVSNLVKSLVHECLNQDSKIKQMFILTHNVYFHKEVTFKGSRENPSGEEAFWLVRKKDCQSSIEIVENNPINTSYDLLWNEIRDRNNLNKVTVFNTLRRILEYYFKIIGGYDYERMVNEFEFEDKQAYKALISWINDGSHFVIDDLFVDTDLDSIEQYLNVFKEIFVKLGHESHYKMMMKCS